MAAAAASAEAQSQAVPTVELAPGFPISRIIKGCWQLSGGHRGERASDRTSGDAAVQDFQKFVDAGITTFDTADIYGPSESLIGRYLASRGGSEGVQVLTKFCCFGAAMRSARDLKFVEESIDLSRQRLGVDALDVVQFYWHDYGEPYYVDAAKHLAELQARGKIRHVAVTNFDTQRLKEIVDAGVRVVSNQVQYSLLDRRPELGPMADYCASQNIALLPYGAIAGGFLSDKYLGLDPGRVQVNTYSLSKYASVINQVGDWAYLQSLLEALSGVAAKHGVSISDVAAAWVLGRPQVAGVIVGARNANHTADLQRIFSFQLDADDAAAIQAVLDQGRRPTGDCYAWERGGRW